MQSGPERMQPGGGRNAPFGALERRIARRYLGARKSEGGVAVIAAISFVCILLAIAAMIIIMSIMNGFREKLIELTIGSEGHMYVGLLSPDPGPDRIRELEDRLSTLPGVDEAFEFSENFAGIQANGQLTLGRVIGIRPQNLDEFPLIADNIQSGSLDGFGQGRGAAHRIAIGVHLAASLGLSAGDRLRIMTSRTRSTVTGPMPVMKVYTVGAVFNTGLYQTDLNYIYMDLDQSQLLFSNGRKSGEIQMRLIDPDQLEVAARQARDAAGEPVLMQTWKDRNSTTAQALRTEQIAMRMIFIVVVIISTFPILAAMIMLVKNKSRDIAILRTIGATRGSILRIFFLAGSMIGSLGTVAGLAFGIVFCLHINVVQGIIEALTGVELFPADIYHIDTGIPAKVVWGEVAMVALCGFVISAVATFFPALGASKTDPVEELRYD
ncbi:MAG: ABC transporter permease [Hyphomonadaceae bacterium]|nr:ABC transporter permease [Hyphomonadaceae bacterium]MBC6412912.1 ABC transporter permease [Hyphomonadaceae bacterium]